MGVGPNTRSQRALRHRLLEAALRRVAASPAGAQLALRGSLLTRAWLGADLREADDIDFIACFPSDILRAEALLKGALSAPSEDGVTLHLDTWTSWTTWEDTDDPGLRVTLEASVGGDRAPIQMDIGFGDPMDPPPARTPYPAAPPLSVLSVRPETALAWKLHGLFEMPNGRWRPKDLWDIHLLLTHLPMEPEALQRAVRLAFESRHTPLVVTRRLLDGGLGLSRSSRVAWRGFLRAQPGGDPPAQHLPLIQDLAQRLRPLLEGLIQEDLGPPRPPPTLAPGRLFPRITHLSELLPAIAGRPEFRVHRRGPLLSVVYETTRGDSFPDPAHAQSPRDAWLRAARRECRGLSFDAEGRLLGRKLHRFFNLGERPECRLEVVASWPGLLALPKLDGSMLTPLRVDGALLWTTRRGPSDIAQRAADHAREHLGDYAGLIGALHAEGLTPTFEWCSPANRLILPQPRARLVLLAARHAVEGFYLPHDALQREAAAHGVPAVAPLTRPLRSPAALSALVAETRAARDTEGLILRAADGRMAKLKSDWFRRLHSVVEQPQHGRPLWAVLLRGEDGDLLSALTEPDAVAVTAYRDQLNAALGEKAAWLTERLQHERRRLESLAPEDGRAALAQGAATLDDSDRALLFRAWGEPEVDAERVLRALAVQRAKTPRGLAALRGWLKLPPWQRPNPIGPR